MPRFPLTATLLLTIGLAAGCTGSPDTRGPLPDGAGLVSAAATTFASVRSVHFSLGVNGVLPGFPLRQIDGDATLDDGGVAKGTADVQNDAERLRFAFVARGRTVTTTPDVRSGELPEQFAVTTLLGPGGGLRRLLNGVTDTRTEGHERAAGVDALRVAGRIPAAVATGVLAEIHTAVIVKVWVSATEPRQFVRLWLQIPPAGPHLSPVMFELALTNQNDPVTISSS